MNVELSKDDVKMVYLALKTCADLFSMGVQDVPASLESLIPNPDVLRDLAHRVMAVSILDEAAQAEKRSN